MVQARDRAMQEGLKTAVGIMIDYNDYFLS